MKTTSFTFLILLFSFALFGQRSDNHYPPYEIGVKTLEFKVLDINFEKKLVAFKHIFELQEGLFDGPDGEYEANPIDCKYAGMGAYPRAGVVLGIYDLEKGDYLKTFTIYKSCYDPEDCYAHEISVLNLDSAKQMFKDYGLDIEKVPKPLKFNENNENLNSLTIDGIKFTSSYKNDHENFQTISYLNANGDLLYFIEYFETFIYSGKVEVFYQAAYKVGNRVVFLNKYFRENKMYGEKSWEFFKFSPVFEIKGLRVELK